MLVKTGISSSPGAQPLAFPWVCARASLACVLVTSRVKGKVHFCRTPVPTWSVQEAVLDVGSWRKGSGCWAEVERASGFLEDWDGPGSSRERSKLRGSRRGQKDEECEDKPKEAGSLTPETVRTVLAAPRALSCALLRSLPRSLPLPLAPSLLALTQPLPR